MRSIPTPKKPDSSEGSNRWHSGWIPALATHFDGAQRDFARVYARPDCSGRLLLRRGCPVTDILALQGVYSTGLP